MNSKEVFVSYLEKDFGDHLVGQGKNSETLNKLGRIFGHPNVGKNTVVHAAEARLKIDLVTLKFFPFYEP